jgi:hypothetical protein
MGFRQKIDSRIYFINLTCGIEWIPFLDKERGEIHFIRIQSTLLEQGHMERVLQDLDNNFLMHLAIGNTCIFYDVTSRYSSERGSRSIWQGIEWIKYCLNKLWFNKKIKCPYGQHHHFEKEFKKLSKTTRKKLKYYRKFLQIENLNNLRTICDSTIHDSDTTFYKNIIGKWSS